MEIQIRVELYKNSHMIHAEIVPIDKYGNPPPTLVFDAEKYHLTYFWGDKAKYSVVTSDDEIPF